MLKRELLPLPSQPPSRRFLSTRTFLTNLFFLVIGILIGCHLTISLLNNNNKTQFDYHTEPINFTTIMQDAESVKNITSTPQTPTYTITTTTKPTTTTTLSPDVDTEDIVEYLHRSTRVLCWIMTTPDNHLTKAIHIRNTWGSRCNKLLFMSSEEDEDLGTIKLDVQEGRRHLWDKTQNALKYIYDHHFAEADWFLKADDDTYIIMENLRLFLYRYPPEAAVYFGCKFKRYIKQGYMSGGAGYVLSKTALEKFATEAYNNTETCNQVYQAEDTQLGLCLQNIGVLAGDSRDEERKERFVPLAPDLIIPEDKTWWYKKFVYHNANENATCCSSSAISFHYITPDQFYVLDYLLYTLRPFGVKNAMALPRKINVSDLFSEALEYFYPLPSPPPASMESEKVS